MDFSHTLVRHRWILVLALPLLEKVLQLMPLYGWGSVADLLKYGCVHYPLDCDLWLHGSRVREF
jgi:hypothetical protein